MFADAASGVAIASSAANGNRIDAILYRFGRWFGVGYRLNAGIELFELRGCVNVFADNRITVELKTFYAAGITVIKGKFFFSTSAKQTVEF